jgi:RNA polymerase sigma factor (sigma-70 family)
VEWMNEGVAAAVLPMTPEQLEAFYTAEYPKLVKLLVFFGATIGEAEDATQKAMADFTRRSRTAEAPVHPASYAQRAAVRFFIKERQRERKRLPRELQGGYLVVEAHLDDRLTVWEDKQYIEHLLECLTSTQRKVIKLVMDGLSTREIAQELGKSDVDVRQHLKNGRARLKLHPEITPLAPRQDQSPAQQGVRSTVTTQGPRKEEVQ